MRRVSQISAVLFGAVFVAVGAAHAQTVDAIIAKNIQAKGGAEKISATTSVKMVATTSMQGTEMKTTVYSKRPNLLRHEAEVAGQKMVTVFDGTTLWMIMPNMPPQRAPEAQVAAMKQQGQAEFDSIFMTYKAEGHKIELVGTETLDGRSVHHLKVTRKDGPVQHYYLDAQTGLEAKTSTSVDNTTVETRMEDYRQIEGRMVPFKLTQYANGTKVAETHFESVEFNPPLDEALFKPAAK